MEIKIANELFHVSSAKSLKNLSYNAREENGIFTTRLNVELDGREYPPQISLTGELPVVGVCAFWSPALSLRKNVAPEWESLCFNSSVSENMPLFCAYDGMGKNILTLYLSDVKTPLKLSFGVVEETQRLRVKIVVFSALSAKRDEYSVDVIADVNPVPFYQAIKKARDYYAAQGYRTGYVPPEAFNAVYSSWYNFHQNISEEKLVEECAIAKKIGFDTVIVDDGWQTGDNNRGFVSCGDWIPYSPKFPDMRRFVDRIHALGMKVMLWYAVPFIGDDAKNYHVYKNKFLFHNEEWKCNTLDPRYPDVRAFLVNVFATAASNWNLDGFKLDFIDSFYLTEESGAVCDEMDTSSVENAVEILLGEIKDALTAIRKDVLIEFRQKYIGPVMMKYGNTFRVHDCPLDNLKNRVSGIDLRLISQGAAVHGDMVIWNEAERKEDCALRLYANAFVVPQISVLLKEIPNEQLQTVAFFLKTWNENKSLFLSEDLKPYSADGIYVKCEGITPTEKAVVCYADRYVSTDGKDGIIVLNAASENLIIDCLNDSYVISIYDCAGNLKEQTVIEGLKSCGAASSDIAILKKAN